MTRRTAFPVLFTDVRMLVAGSSTGAQKCKKKPRQCTVKGSSSLLKPVSECLDIHKRKGAVRERTLYIQIFMSIRHDEISKTIAPLRTCHNFSTKAFPSKLISDLVIKLS